MINTKMATGFTTGAAVRSTYDLHETSKVTPWGKTPRASAWVQGIGYIHREHGVKVMSVKRDGFSIRWCYAQ